MSELMNIEELRYEDLPPGDDVDAIISWLNSFNAYKRYGSFEKFAAREELASRQNVEDLMVELYMYWRASAHQGSGRESLPGFYQELLPYFKRLLP